MRTAGIGCLRSKHGRADGHLGSTGDQRGSQAGRIAEQRGERPRQSGCESGCKSGGQPSGCRGSKPVGLRGTCQPW